MTLTTFIIINAVLASTIAYGLVHFLVHGVHADRRDRGRGPRGRVVGAAPRRARPHRRVAHLYTAEAAL
jgi:KaiC/GvpD/RAD55 family RecA-like ATPase